MLRRSLFAALLLGTVACATYRDDFDRARAHYEGNRYDQALALLEILEHDIDSLSVAERAQYAYFRGMSHFRLEQSRDARHWLGNAAARELAAQGALPPDLKARLDETLSRLNAPYHGEVAGAGPATAAACQSDPDCGPAAFCDAGRCATSGAIDNARRGAPRAVTPKRKKAAPSPSAP